jgi:hypothetical protein
LSGGVSVFALQKERKCVNQQQAAAGNQYFLVSKLKFDC